MQTCMQKYPTLYNKDIADDDDFPGMDEAKGSIAPPVENKQSNADNTSTSLEGTTKKTA